MITSNALDKELAPETPIGTQPEIVPALPAVSEDAEPTSVLPTIAHGKTLFFLYEHSAQMMPQLREQ